MISSLFHRSGRRKKRNKEKLSSVVVPPMEGEGDGDDSGMDGDLFDGDNDSLGDREADISAGVNLDLALIEAAGGVDGSLPLPPLEDSA